MSSIEDRLKELDRFVTRIFGTTIDLDNRLAAVKRRLDEIEEAQNYVLRAFCQMHPDRFGDLDRSANPKDIAFRAFVKTHPEIFADLDRADQVLGIDQTGKKPEA